MAIQKITADVIANSAVTTDSLSDSSITAAKLHTTLDLTGKTVTVATASAGDNDTTVASTAFVSTAIANLADSAPSTLDTLNELAAALGDDASFSTTVTNSIATKLSLAGGTMTGALNMGSQNITNAGTISSGAITSSGNLHVGDGANISMDASANGQLEVDGDGYQGAIALDATAMRIYHNSSSRDLVLGTNETARLTIDGSTGNVGIGTDNAAEALTVNGNIGISDGKIYNGAGSNSAGLSLPNSTVRIDGYNGITFHSSATTIGSQTERMRIDNSGAVGIGVVPQTNRFAGHDVLQIGARGTLLANDTGSSTGQTALLDNLFYNSAGNFRVRDGSNATAGVAMQFVEGKVIFSNSAATTGDPTVTPRMTIDASGNVGIGSSNPSRQITLYKTSNSSYSSSSMETTNLQLYMRNADTTVNNHVGLQFAVGNNSDAAIAAVRTADANAALTFGTRGTGSGNIIERMRINSSGDVGINTTSPIAGSKLDVVDTDDMTMRVRSTGASSSSIRFQNSNTGTTTGDGLFVGVDSQGNAYHYNYENTASIFASNNTEVFRLRSDGAGIEFPDNNTVISTANTAGGSSYEWGSFRRPATGDGGQLSIRQYSSGDTAANYPAYAGGRNGWDENTGMYFPDTDQVGLTAGGNSGLVCYPSTDARGIEVQDCLSSRANTTSTRAREHFYHFLSQATFTYAHMKTNIPWASATQMYSVKFTGHEYGAAKAVDTNLVWYNYNPSNQPVNIGSNGTHTAGLYSSSDGYTVMRITFTNGYYTAFTVSQYPTAQGCAMFNITASAANSTATHY